MNLDRFIYYKNNAFTDVFCDSMVDLFNKCFSVEPYNKNKDK